VKLKAKGSGGGQNNGGVGSKGTAGCRRSVSLILLQMNGTARIICYLIGFNESILHFRPQMLHAIPALPRLCQLLTELEEPMVQPFSFTTIMDNIGNIPVPINVL
jgi:hypothetical protein